MAERPRLVSRRSDLALLAWFLAVVFGTGTLLGLHLDESLLGRAQFRQSQTALSADWMMREGFSLAYPTPLFGPPWSVPMEFPFYQAVVARVTAATGLPLTTVGRLISILFLVAAMPSLYALAGRFESDRIRRLLVPGAALLTPVSLYYSRTFMIESCAAALAIGFLHAFVLTLETRRVRWAAAAAALGSLAAMVKITTFAVVLLPAAAFALWLGKSATGRERNRAWLLGAATLLLSLAAALWWVRFGDAVKHANPFSVALASDQLQAWNFGTLAQRSDGEAWRALLRHFAMGSTGGLSLVAILGALVLAPARHRAACAVCLAAYATTALVFFNLYVVHDYYAFPAALLVGAGAGLALAGATSRDGWRRAVAALVLLAFTAGQSATIHQAWGTNWRQPAPPPPGIARAIAAALPPDGVVIIYGWDWNALLPFEAGRRAIMVPGYRESAAETLEKIVRSLPADTRLALLMQGNEKANPDFIRWRTERFGLRSAPIARSLDGDLYVPSSAVPALAAQFRHTPLDGVEFDWTESTGPLDAALPRRSLVAADFTGITSSAPSAFYSPWSYTRTQIEGREALLANAPSELHFAVPAGARQVSVRFGIVRGAIEGSPPTDGADVTVTLVDSTGAPRTVWRHHLDPLGIPADREVQSRTIALPPGAAGELVFSFSPGPNGNASCDWTFWEKIEIK